MSFVNQVKNEQERARVPILWLREVDFPQLDELICDFAEVAGEVNPVEIYTPKNTREEQEKFFAGFCEGRVGSPSFLYQNDWLISILAKREELLRFSERANDLPEDGEERKFLKSLMIEKVHDELFSIEIAEGIATKNDEQTAVAMAKKYGLASAELVERAEKSYKKLQVGQEPSIAMGVLTSEQQSALIEEVFDAENIKKAFEFALNLYRFDRNWKVVISDKARAIDVRDKSEYGQPVIVIPENRRVDGKKLLELIGHEIECHVRQSMNGEILLRRFGGGRLKDDDETMYEGLAKCSDIDFARKYFGESVSEPMPWYILAGEGARAGETFAHVFESIYEMLRMIGESEDAAMKTAWTATYRVFRGSTDPENMAKFCQPKDRAYFEGYHLARELKDAGLGHFLEAGVMRESTIARVAKWRLSPEELPYPLLDAVAEYAEILLS